MFYLSDIVRSADFINDAGADLPDENDSRRLRRPILMQEDQEDVDEIERRVKERYSKTNQVDYAEDATDVEQQALLPSVKDPKLWMVKCAVCCYLYSLVETKIISNFCNLPMLTILLVFRLAMSVRRPFVSCRNLWIGLICRSNQLLRWIISKITFMLKLRKKPTC